MALARPGTLLDGQAASAVGLQCYLGALEAANTRKRYDVPGTPPASSTITQGRSVHSLSLWRPRGKKPHPTLPKGEGTQSRRGPAGPAGREDHSCWGHSTAKAGLGHHMS